MPHEPLTPRISRTPRRDPPPDKFTVGSCYRPGWPEFRSLAEPFPFLPIAGNCLERAGFTAGTQVLVEAEPGRLLVRLREDKGRS